MKFLNVEFKEELSENELVKVLAEIGFQNGVPQGITDFLFRGKKRKKRVPIQTSRSWAQFKVVAGGMRYHEERRKELVREVQLRPLESSEETIRILSSSVDRFSKVKVTDDLSVLARY